MCITGHAIIILVHYTIFQISNISSPVISEIVVVNAGFSRIKVILMNKPIMINEICDKMLSRNHKNNASIVVQYLVVESLRPLLMCI